MATATKMPRQRPPEGVEPIAPPAELALTLPIPPAGNVLDSTPPPSIEQAPPPPLQSGPSPRPGLMVSYWEHADLTGSGALRPRPAMLIESLRDGSWNLNVHKFRAVVGRTGVRFSEAPKLGHWTFEA